MKDCQSIIEEHTILLKKTMMVKATYIPELAKVNPKKFGVCLTTKEGKQFTYGDFDEAFSIQSVAKSEKETGFRNESPFLCL